MGYASQSKGYRTYNIKEQKVIINRNVVIDKFFFGIGANNRLKNILKLKNLKLLMLEPLLALLAQAILNQMLMMNH